MRHPLPLLAITAGLAFLAPSMARAQIPQGLLQQLLPGNQAQNPGAAEQAVREAYERGYRQGRQDQERSSGERNNRQPQNGGYQGQSNQQNGGYPDQQQRNQYNR